MNTAEWLKASDPLLERTGVVIPVFLPRGIDVGLAEALLEHTVCSFVRQAGDPRSVCLSVDGPGPGAAVAARLAAEQRVRLVLGPVNRGKLSGARAGAAELLSDRRLQYLAVADQDGDHFAHELANFLRAARHAEEQGRTDRILALGRRISRHRPMGFLRGEMEEIADRILLDALRYRAARTGRPLRLEFTTAFGEFPDFHSGYKLFSRPVAESVFLSEPNPCGMDDDAYFRHACEAVMIVEALEAGALLVEVNRSTLDEQPVSAFGLLDRRRLMADKILWPCRRLDVPPEFVAQWMRDHMPRLLLGTLVPEGREELLGIRRLVLRACGLADGLEDGRRPPVRPAFV